MVCETKFHVNFTLVSPTCLKEIKFAIGWQLGGDSSTPRLFAPTADARKERQQLWVEPVLGQDGRLIHLPKEADTQPAAPQR